MRELIDGLVQSAQHDGMELYGVHVYRRGAVTITAHVEAGSARTSITTLVTEKLLNHL